MPKRCSFARRGELGAGAIGPDRGPNGLELGVRCTQVDARLGSMLMPAQELAVQRPCSPVLERIGRALEQAKCVYAPGLTFWRPRCKSSRSITGNI